MEPISIDDTAAYAADEIEKAAGGRDVAWHMSNGIEALQRGVKERELISAPQCESIVRAALNARDEVLSLFSSLEDRQLASKGVDAVIGLAILWGEPPARRALRHPHVRPDLEAYARVLRNRCHDLNLLEEIKSRAEDRQAELVKNMLREASA
ncbi:hypothetical protein JF546_16345 [Nitratireductor aquimarinus]|uniref:hypothetical protein n=1 Tax=Nitratireductor aquimarinus TaxID=889300 RepID=UPI001A8BF9DB|nr:hypothetical protein [Nitratireductor aquimarinus]MBN8244589.1 hypothetical protein [Nitratireductor aquimarinus]MBY6132976.1 hypothetical protein [Nitratireductor aquimarinus]MCA1301818.1 hypothetical protein [Nitratireductor aquimarinus]